MLQLNLEPREWMALYRLLVRMGVPGELNGPLLGKVMRRMHETLITMLGAQESNLAAQWLEQQQQKITQLRHENDETTQAIEKILTADDDEGQQESRSYPKRGPRMPKPGRKGRRRR